MAGDTNHDGKCGGATGVGGPPTGQDAGDGVVRDALGQPVPANLRAVFAAPSLTEADRILGTLLAPNAGPGVLRRLERTELGHLSFVPATKIIDHLQAGLLAFRTAADLLAANLPHAVCPQCQGTGGACKGCRGGGWVPDWRLAELKAEAAPAT